jgi:hypothetical protein
MAFSNSQRCLLKAGSYRRNEDRSEAVEYCHVHDCTCYHRVVSTGFLSFISFVGDVRATIENGEGVRGMDEARAYYRTQGFADIRRVGDVPRVLDQRCGKVSKPS